MIYHYNNHYIDHYNNHYIDHYNNHYISLYIYISLHIMMDTPRIFDLIDSDGCLMGEIGEITMDSHDVPMVVEYEY